MSVESLIFLAIFFLLPLIERLRERNQRQRPSTPPERGDDLDPMLPAPPRPRAERPAPSRPVPPPPPIPVETRRPEPAPGPAPSQPKRPGPGPRQPVPQPAAEVMPAEVLRAVRSRERAIAQRAATAAATRARRAPAGPARQAVGRILRNPQSLRRAMMVATILGPCRGLEHES
jgi:type IV secretory pathway VirB10-like protein